MGLFSGWQRWRARDSAQPSRLLGVLTVSLAVAVVAFSGAAGAAPSKTSTTSPGSGKSPSSSSKASTSAYLSCLKKHGVSIPKGGFGGFGSPSGSGATSGGTRPTFPKGSGSGSSKFEKAAKACASLRPKGTNPFGGGGNAANSAAFLAYRNCLKLHGVTLPTRTQPSGTKGSSSSTTTTIAASNPKMKAALAACAPLLPKGFSGTSSKKPSDKSSGKSSKKS